MFCPESMMSCRSPLGRSMNDCPVIFVAPVHLRDWMPEGRRLMPESSSFLILEMFKCVIPLGSWSSMSLFQVKCGTRSRVTSARGRPAEIQSSLNGSFLFSTSLMSEFGSAGTT